MFIALLLRFIGLIIIEVGSSIRLFLFQLHVLHHTFGCLVVVFQLSLLTHFNRIGKVPLLLISFGAAGVGLGTIFEGSHVGLANFYRLKTRLNTLIVFFSSEVDGSLVIHKRHAGGVQGNGFVICGQGLIEFLGFVKIISTLLALDCSLLIFLLLTLRRGQLGKILFLLRRLRLFLLRLLLRLRIAAAIRGAGFVRCFWRLIFVHSTISSQRQSQDLHDLGVTQHLRQ
mmetsp:Transcript_17152/g.36050  ORF Transcript_17152/g.36050 Transcript_17152/m.36050 type:complete len:228 (+) Transcript_17152:1061-1744(+)